jgi:hypothetical protein
MPAVETFVLAPWNAVLFLWGGLVSGQKLPFLSGHRETFAKRDIFSSGKEGNPAKAGLTGGPPPADRG